MLLLRYKEVQDNSAQIKENLSRIYIDERILEVFFGTSVLVLRIFQNEDEKLGGHSCTRQQDLNPEVSLVVDVDGKRNDEANAVNHQQMKNDFLGNDVLPVDQLLDTLFQVELRRFLSLLQHVSQEEIRNRVDSLRIISKLAQVMCALEFIGWSTHHFVNLNLSN